MVIKIFRKWDTDVIKKPLNDFTSYVPLFLPLYSNLKDQMMKIDQYEYAKHLEDPFYSKINTIYNNLGIKEDLHNKAVSDYFHKFYEDIIDKIRSETKLMNVYDVSKLIKFGEINEKDKEALEMGAISPSVGFYPPYLLEYLSNRMGEKSLLEIDLKVKEETNNGWVYGVLTSSRFLEESKIIAKSPLGRRQVEDLRKILLTDDFIEITHILQNFRKEVQEIHDLYYDLIHETNRLVNNFGSLGLKGKCNVELELDFWKKACFGKTTRS
ncbi:MAG: hypothetical protein AB7V56_09070 [Candidatus Nitrosocosmicus sp.]